MSSYLKGRGVHIDRPRSNFAVEAFDSMQDFVAPRIMPRVNVDKRSDGYWVLDQDMWLRIENTRRSPLQPANAGEWQVSTDTYFCENFAFRTPNAMEDLANADTAIRLRDRSTRYTVEMIQRDRELRVANLVTSIDNIGSGTSLSGSDKWSDGTSSPISQVNTAFSFIEDRTGLTPNTMLLDRESHRTLRYHPELREYMKYTGEGPLTDDMLRQIFNIDNIIVAFARRNQAKEGQNASLTNIWGNNALIARIENNTGMQTATLGTTFVWTPSGFPAPFAVERYEDPNPSVKAEWVESQIFFDEKIIASDLGYLIESTL